MQAWTLEPASSSKSAMKQLEDGFDYLLSNYFQDFFTFAAFLLAGHCEFKEINDGSKFGSL